MYVQSTRISTHPAALDSLRRQIESTYLPLVRLRHGSVRAFLLAPTPDNPAVEVVQMWDTHASAEAFARTGALGQFLGSLVAQYDPLEIVTRGDVEEDETLYAAL